MTDCQMFKAAFLQACVDDGMTLDEIHDFVKSALATAQEKSADGLFSKGLGAVQNLAGKAMNLGVASYFGVPIGAGIVGGWGAAQLGNLADDSPGEVKQREKIELLKRMSQQLELQKRLRTEQDRARPSRRIF